MFLIYGHWFDVTILATYNRKIQQNNTVTKTTPYLFAPQLPNYDRGKTKMRQGRLIVIFRRGFSFAVLAGNTLLKPRRTTRSYVLP